MPANCHSSWWAAPKGRRPVLLLMVWLQMASELPLLGADPLEVWEAPTNGIPTSVDLFDIAYGGGVFVAVGAHGTVVLSSDAEHWLTANAATSNDLRAVKWIGDHFVTTDGSRTAVSAQGSVWSWADEPPPAALDQPNATACGDSYYVDVGTWVPGEIRTSRDGVHWASERLGIERDLYAVAFGNHRFVVVGSGGTLLHSGLVPPILNNTRPVLAAVPDQETDELKPWHYRVIAEDPDAGDHLTFGLAPDAPVGVTVDPLSGELAWTPREEDGPAVHPVGVWVHDGGEPPLYDLQWFNLTVHETNSPPQLRVLPGVILDHEMTVSIEASDPDSPLNGLHYDLDEFPEGTLLNLTTRQYFWTPTAEQVGTVAAFGIRVTDDGSPPLSASGRLEVLALTRDTLTLEPTPLLRWSATEVPIMTNYVWDIEFVRDQFIVVGEAGDLFSSRDGVDWVRARSGVGVSLRAVAEGAGVVVVAGDRGTVLVSREGMDWGPATLGAAPDLGMVAYGAGQFVALGGNPIVLFTSADGFHWTNHGPVETRGSLSHLIWTGREFIAVGGDFNPSLGQTRTMLRSLDGLTWVEDTHEGVPLSRLAQGGGRTVAVGGSSYLWASWGTSEVSRDGVNWTQRGEMRLWDVAYGNGRFIALGVETGRVWEYDYFLISRDGLFWEPHREPDGVAPSLVAYGNGRFVAIADAWRWIPPTGRRVLVCTSIPDPEPRAVIRANGWPSGGFCLALHGQDGVPYRIDVSEDLVHWREWRRVTGVFGGLLETDPDSFSLARRFYRMVPVP